MRNTLIVVADLGAFKAFRVNEDEMNSAPRLEPLIAVQPGEAASHKRGNTLTVIEGKSAKRPSNPGTSGVASDGEQHNMHLEKTRRSIRGIADNFEQLYAREKPARCLLAAPEEILGQVLETIRPDLRNQIEKALPLDLTRADKPSLIEHFYGVRSA